MRDDHYRNSCENPKDYDGVIDWIKENNPAAKSAEERGVDSAEDFAVWAVHNCISGVLYAQGDNLHYSTGMCIAVRYSKDPSSPNYKKVVLGITLLGLWQEQRRKAAEGKVENDNGKAP